MKRGWLIVADDLTGANDTAVQFRKKGFKTVVLIEPSKLSEATRKYDAVAIDTETRTLKCVEAYRKLKNISNLIREIGFKQIYKKIDSTMRGNIGCELDALIEELGLDAVIVSPAFIENGRIVVGGYLLINGVPVEKTGFSRDPLNPVKTSYVPSILSSQSKHKVCHLELGKILKGHVKVSSEILKMIEQGCKIIVADAVDVKCLDEITLAFEVISDRKIILCGSAGLASRIAQHHKPPFKMGKKVLMVVGSVNKVSVDQVWKLLSERRIEDVTLKLENLLEPRKKMEEKEKIVSKIKHGLKRDLNILVKTFEVDRDAHLYMDFLKWEGGKEITKLLTEFIGEVTGEAIKRNFNLVGALVVVGGETSISILKKIGITEITLIDEILPGIPLCKVNLTGLGELFLVTKAGGFGDEETLIDILKHVEKDINQLR